MRLRWLPPALLAVVLVLDAGPVYSESQHERVWNRFAEQVFSLHERQLAGREIQERSRIDGYAGRPEFYREVEYTDADSGALLSRIRWVRERPGTIDVIEVFVRDRQGRVVRDYTVAWLPDYRSAPSQTLISLHAYNGGLHAFRTFDASGERLHERCQGESRGQPVYLEVDQDMFYDARLDPGPIFESEAYRRCFGELPSSVEGFLPPR